MKLKKTHDWPNIIHDCYTVTWPNDFITSFRIKDDCYYNCDVRLYDANITQ